MVHMSFDLIRTIDQQKAFLIVSISIISPNKKHLIIESKIEIIQMHQLHTDSKFTWKEPSFKFGISRTVADRNRPRRRGAWKISMNKPPEKAKPHIRLNAILMMHENSALNVGISILYRNTSTTWYIVIQQRCWWPFVIDVFSSDELPLTSAADSVFYL